MTLLHTRSLTTLQTMLFSHDIVTVIAICNKTRRIIGIIVILQTFPQNYNHNYYLSNVHFFLINLFRVLNFHISYMLVLTMYNQIKNLRKPQQTL